MVNVAGWILPAVKQHDGCFAAEIKGTPNYCLIEMLTDLNLCCLLVSPQELYKKKPISRYFVRAIKSEFLGKGVWCVICFHL
jgi:hypothetical protein